MTIQEAIKSGKAFRKKTWRSKLWYLATKYGITSEDGIVSVLLTAQDILADDWIVREE